MTSAAIVGSLACQKDPLLRELATTVLDCHELSDSLYELTLADTVLFPEGGGQPSDKGSVGGHAVVRLSRSGLVPKHVVAAPIEPGSAVTVAVDWDTRLDHMQQHTGQHLLSDVLDTLGLETLSWNMGADTSYVELARAATDQEVAEVQATVNSVVRAAAPVSVFSDASVVDPEKGVMRTVTIDGFPANPCCGTHCPTTALLQQCVLLHQEKVRGGHSRLFFVFGERAGRLLRNHHLLLRSVFAATSSTGENVVDKVVQFQAAGKKSANHEAALVKEVAGYKAREVQAVWKKGSTAVVFRSDVGLEYAQVVVKEAGNGGNCVVVCGEKEGGAVVCVGDKAGEYGEALKGMVGELKGGGKGKWQGKVGKWGKGELAAVRKWAEEVGEAI